MNFVNKDVQELLQLADLASYDWNIGTDKMLWSPGASEILGVKTIDSLSLGRNYIALFDESNIRTLYDHILNHTRAPSVKSSVRYELTYALCPLGHDQKTRIWIEDSGRWFPGPNNKPAHACGLIRQVNARHEREQRLIYLNQTDKLTGKLSRQALTSALCAAIDRAKSNNFTAAFLIISVNNLELINQSYGFNIADNMLRKIATQLHRKLRTTDLIGRCSGNKFGIILSECHPPDLEIVIKRLIKTISDMEISMEAIPVARMISVGAVLIPTDADTDENALISAQDALDQCKKTSSVPYVIYRGDKKRESVRQKNLKIINLITMALNEGNLTYSLQPIVNARNKKIIMYECLMRIRQMDGTILNTDSFLKHAETLGLIGALDCRMIELAISNLIQNPDINLTVNVSIETTSHRTWIDILETQAQHHPDLARRLTIEITETTFIHDIKHTQYLIATLRALGYKVAIDDFGAGYTSFRNLKLLNVDLVKIDGSFIKGLSNDLDNQVYVRSFIDLARHFNILTVAECVETEEDATLLKIWGIDYLQGYLSGRPELYQGNGVHHPCMLIPDPMH
ncbi:MAG: phosphodiesterase [Alphaproteobacteria bacterium]|nr:phosphodiesterase [Alphaproteobacteria bacterium]